MAYVIPVAALVIDEATAAAALNKPADFFENPQNDRWQAVDDLATLTGAPIQSFSDEDGDIFYIGLHLVDDWCIYIDAPLLAKVRQVMQQYQHPLVQGARLAVVSQFC